jgi:hypothetical protein
MAHNPMRGGSVRCDNRVAATSPVDADGDNNVPKLGFGSVERWRSGPVVGGGANRGELGRPERERRKKAT